MISQMELNYWEDIRNGVDSCSEGSNEEEEEEEENSDAEPDEDEEEELEGACEELVERVEASFLNILDGMIDGIEDKYDMIGPIPDLAKILIPNTTTISKDSKTKSANNSNNNNNNNTNSNNYNNNNNSSSTPSNNTNNANAPASTSSLTKILHDSRDEGTQTEGLYPMEKSQTSSADDDDMMKTARKEISSLRLAKETLVNQRKEISDRIKKGLSENEELDEKRVYEFEEAIEAIDSAIEYKNEVICGRDITLSNCLAPGKNEANLVTRLSNLSTLDLQRLLWKYLSKVVELRYSSKRLEKQVGEQETDYEKMSVVLSRTQRHKQEMEDQYEERISEMTVAVSKNPSTNHLNQGLAKLNKRLTNALKKQYDLERSLTELLVRHGYLLNGTDYDVKQVVKTLGIDTEKFGLNWRPEDDEKGTSSRRAVAGGSSSGYHHSRKDKSKTRDRDRRNSGALFGGNNGNGPGTPVPSALPIPGGIPPEIRSALESGLGTSRRMREREAYNNYYHYYDDDPSSHPHYSSGRGYEDSRHRDRRNQPKSSSSRHHYHRSGHPQSSSYYDSSSRSHHYDNTYGGSGSGHHHHNYYPSSSPQPQQQPGVTSEVRREKQKLIIKTNN